MDRVRGSPSHSGPGPPQAILGHPSLTSAAGGQQPAGFVAADGRLWFPTYRGVAVLDPARIRTSGRPPRVAIEDVFVDGRPADLRGPLVLTPGTERGKLHSAALTLVAPDRVRFQHRLDGLENEPADVGPRRTTTRTCRAAATSSVSPRPTRRASGVRR